MKKLIVPILLLFPFLAISQDDIKTHGIYYKISLAGTLTTNEDYTVDPNDDTGSFIEANAVFVNNSVGYQFDGRSSIDLNVEYDYYTKQALHFLPVHLGFNYTILDFDDVVFIRGGYGKLIKAGKSFEKGTMYKVGIGYRIFDDDFRNSWLIGFDFNRKRFGYKQKEKLSSFSIFLEFMLF